MHKWLVSYIVTIKMGRNVVVVTLQGVTPIENDSFRSSFCLKTIPFRVML